MTHLTLPPHFFEVIKGGFLRTWALDEKRSMTDAVLRDIRARLSHYGYRLIIKWSKRQAWIEVDSESKNDYGQKDFSDDFPNSDTSSRASVRAHSVSSPSLEEKVELPVQSESSSSLSDPAFSFESKYGEVNREESKIELQPAPQANTNLIMPQPSPAASWDHVFDFLVSEPTGSPLPPVDWDEMDRLAIREERGLRFPSSQVGDVCPQPPEVKEEHELKSLPVLSNSQANKPNPRDYLLRLPVGCALSPLELDVLSEQLLASHPPHPSPSSIEPRRPLSLAVSSLQLDTICDLLLPLIQGMTDCSLTTVLSPKNMFTSNTEWEFHQGLRYHIKTLVRIMQNLITPVERQIAGKEGPEILMAAARQYTLAAFTELREQKQPLDLMADPNFQGQAEACYAAYAIERAYSARALALARVQITPAFVGGGFGLMRDTIAKRTKEIVTKYGRKKPFWQRVRVHMHNLFSKQKKSCYELPKAIGGVQPANALHSLNTLAYHVHGLGYVGELPGTAYEHLVTSISEHSAVLPSVPNFPQCPILANCQL